MYSGKYDSLVLPKDQKEFYQKEFPENLQKPSKRLDKKGLKPHTGA